MPVLSIIACGMLKDELAHVLSQDGELQQLILVENRESQGFFRELRAGNCLPRTVPLDRVPLLLNSGHEAGFGNIMKPLLLFSFFNKMHEKMKRKAARKVTVVVNLLRLGLHTDLELLRSEVYENIREMAPFSDGILLFYGTCGHALGKLEEDFAELGCPLYFLKDPAGETVEDCISLALGGNEAYAGAMLASQGVGTIYLTPMWASNWNQMENEGNGSPDLNRKYLKNSHYGRVVKINTGLSCGLDFHKNVREFAKVYAMEIEEMKGNMELAEHSYQNAKSSVVSGYLEKIIEF